MAKKKAPAFEDVYRSRQCKSFQGTSSVLWRAAIGKGYEDFLAPSEMAELSLYFQQRHLLAHREGIVDQNYGLPQKFCNTASEV